MRKVAVFFVLVLLIAGGTYLMAGRGIPPEIQIVTPARVIGAATPAEIVVGVPRARLSSLRVEIEQNGQTTAVFSLPGGDTGLALEDHPGGVRLMGTVGSRSLPGLRSGPARLIVSAARTVLFGLRSIPGSAVRDLQVRLEQPRVAVISTHHYVNLGGSEAIVYRVSPPDVLSGVVVGNLEYPGFPIGGAKVEGVTASDPGMRLAFFALRYDQPLTTPMHLFARDEAGNTGRAEFEHRTFPKPQKASRIEITDTFLERVVPAILAGTSEVTATGSLLERFLVVNGELRRKNASTIASFAKSTSPELLWGGQVFHPFTNSAAAAAFADQRTYFYQGREIDRQVHLGFDLASFANTAILAANQGRVLFAAELGIYGNCVILDHGMGVQSLYGHLSSIDVVPGTLVTKSQVIGKSGITGLAGGDHLHFTMLVNGQMVNPVEWWDTHWIQDRVLRKLKEIQQ